MTSEWRAPSRRATTPVFTGIGHTGDESIADLVAHTRAITPTKLGEEIVSHRANWYAEQCSRGRPARCSARPRHCSTKASEYVAERRRTMIFAVRDRLRAEQRHLASTHQRLLIQSATSAGERHPDRSPAPVNSWAPTIRRNVWPRVGRS
jgi:exonuclease VII large subunit